jgi:hypothetical protein
MSLRLMFYWTPRTGGESVWATIARARWISGGARLSRQRCADHATTAAFDPRRELTTFQHKPIARLLADDNVTEEWISSAYKFTFVRDPLDRLVSIYQHLWGGTARQRKAVLPFGGFDGFARHVVDTPPDQLANYVDYARPQVTWAMNCDFVGRFSWLQEDYDKLCGSLGLRSPRLRHDNRSRKHIANPWVDEQLRLAAEKHYEADYELLERIGY